MENLESTATKEVATVHGRFAHDRFIEKSRSAKNPVERTESLLPEFTRRGG